MDKTCNKLVELSQAFLYMHNQNYYVESKNNTN